MRGARRQTDRERTRDQEHVAEHKEQRVGRRAQDETRRCDAIGEQDDALRDPFRKAGNQHDREGDRKAIVDVKDLRERGALQAQDAGERWL